jgi:DNA mismatch repair protein MutL
MSVRRVAILPDAVADQIAAGEVVERPASAVKELVENALDAGARHVVVEIENGGKTRLVVTDDGSGMPREDAILALDRHATSKITSAADLVGVRTFGFRGEALPAIASVSRFELLTAPADGPATQLGVNGGRLDRVADGARRRGTTVEVRALFYNVPARRKFLRSAASETRACGEVLATLALAHPDVGFEFSADGETRMRVPAGQSAEDRLAAVWGLDVARTFVPVDFAQGAFRVIGFCQRPADATPAGRRVQLFVNGRPFKDSFLVRAAERGYRSAIHPGDRPSLFLDIRCDPAQVDVNVHPAKLEVRFRERIECERVTEEAIRHAIGGLLAAAALRPDAPSGPGDDRRTGLSSVRPEMDAVGAPASMRAGIASADVVESHGAAPPLSVPLADPFADLFAVASPAAPSLGTELPPAHVVQLFRSYLVYETADAVVFVDQHSAHERVLYEETMAALTSGQGASQRLLLPLTLDATDEELDAIDAHRAELERLGFELAPFGGRTVLVSAVPAPHPRFDALACLRELVSDLARGRFGGWANRLERFAATFACRAAVKAGMALDPTEQRALLGRLFACALPPHDVHGRSTIVRIPRDELERRFGRA